MVTVPRYCHKQLQEIPKSAEFFAETFQGKCENSSEIIMNSIYLILGVKEIKILDFTHII